MRFPFSTRRTTAPPPPKVPCFFIESPTPEFPAFRKHLLEILPGSDFNDAPGRFAPSGGKALNEFPLKDKFSVIAKVIFTEKQRGQRGPLSPHGQEPETAY